ncbi:MAG: hypothetical protein ABI552_07635, partial [Casimicrobiaceae bacterium]
MAPPPHLAPSFSPPPAGTPPPRPAPSSTAAPPPPPPPPNGPSFGATAGDAAAAASAALGKIDGAGIIARVKNILLSPRTEWQVISAESRSGADVWMGYVAPLAALAAIAAALGMMI